MAIPLLKGQVSCREVMNGETLLAELKKDEMLKIDLIDSPYSKNVDLREIIYNRGF